MIAYLNFCHHDRDMALRLLKWIGKLGGVKGHDLVLQSSQGIIRDGLHVELFEEAKKHFKAVDHFTPFTEDERGWPYSPNHGWMQALQHVREKLQQPWFWMEPDCVPLKSTWMDEIEAEYAASKKPFMGAEVTHPQHRMSGVGVYPPIVIAYLRNRRLGDMAVRQDAFDVYFAPEIVPNAHFTKLIQNVHFATRNPDALPTFPDVESLKFLDSQAVLFHRCKDGSLIEQLSKRQAELDSSESHKLASAGSIPATATSSREAELLAEIERLKEHHAQSERFATAARDFVPVETKPKKSSAQSPDKVAARVAKAMETKRKKKERSEKLKAAWVRRKSKVAA